MKQLLAGPQKFVQQFSETQQSLQRGLNATLVSLMTTLYSIKRDGFSHTR